MVPLIGVTSREVSTVLDQWCLSHYPLSLYLLTDNGSHSFSLEFQESLDSLVIHHVTTITYNPRGSWICDIIHDTINSRLRILSDFLFTAQIPKIVWSLRTFYH